MQSRRRGLQGEGPCRQCKDAGVRGPAAAVTRGPAPAAGGRGGEEGQPHLRVLLLHRAGHAQAPRQARLLRQVRP